MSAPNALTLSLALAVLAAAPSRAASAPAPAPAAPAAQAKPGSAEVKASSSTLTPAQIYTVERLRDPFSAPGAAGGAGKTYSVETDFSIHNLSLRGVMKDPSSDYALFTDPNFGVSFILRNGKLYDSRNKIVPGVAGKLKTREKWAQLETPEHDVQVFRLGEEEKD
jgi:hypothetical protein